MAIARFAPDALTTQTNLTGSLANIQDDPDTPDANWLIATSNNVTVTAHVTFPDPPGALALGPNLQEFRVLVRRTGTSGTGTTTAQVFLYENGTLVSSGVSTDVTSTTGQVLSYTWDATGRNAALIECRVVGTASGGGPSVRATIDVGAIEWNGDHGVWVTGIASGEIVPSPQISFALQEVTGVGAIATGEAIGGPSVLFTSPYPVGIASAEAFGTARTLMYLTGVGAITAAEAVGTPRIVFRVAPTAIGSAEAFGVPALLKIGVFPEAIPSAEVFGAPAVIKNPLFPTGIASAEAFGSLTFQLFMPPIRPVGMASEEEFGSVTVRFSGWWSKTFPYRRRLLVQSTDEPIPVGHPIEVLMPLAVTKEQGKIREDLADVEVVLMDSAQRWHRLGRHVETTDTDLLVRFLALEAIPIGETAEYYIHYGAPASEGVGRPVFVDNPWPVRVVENAGRIAFTRPKEHWVNGQSRRRGAQATLEFVGAGVRIVSVKGPNQGVAEAQVDNGPWQEVDLFAPAATTAEVFSITALDIAPHKVRFRATGRANPNAAGDEVNLTEIDYVTSVFVQDEPEEVNVEQWGGGGLGGG